MDYLYSNQECSSGCESGWTLYLDHSSISPYNQEHDFLDERRSRVLEPREKGLHLQEEDEEGTEEDEDLSMVSDASSGPPHFHEQEGYEGNDNSFNYQNDVTFSRNRNKSKENRRRKQVQDQSSLLDDTASSPLFDFSNQSFILARNQPSMENVLEYSQCYSSTQFEVRRPYQEHYDFFQSPPSPNQLQQNQWFEGKMW